MMGNYKAETKVDTEDAIRVRTEAKGYTPSRGKAHGASETGSSAKLGGSGSSGNKSRNHRYGGFKGTALVVLLTFSMVFASLLGAFADNLTPVDSTGAGGTVPADENYTTSITTFNDGKGADTLDTLVGPSPYNGATAKVRQSQSTTSATTFAAGLPLSTIYIDQSKIKAQPGKVTVLPSDYSSLIKVDATSGRVNFDAKNAPNALKMYAGKINELKGNLYYVIFEKAAVLPDGSTADLKITYSDAKIVIDQRYAYDNRAYDGEIFLSQGANFSYGGTSTTDISTLTGATTRQSQVNQVVAKFSGNGVFANGNMKNPMIGKSMDATYQIVTPVTQIPIEGTFIYAISGINLDRDAYRISGTNYGKPLWYIDKAAKSTTAAASYFSGLTDAERDDYHQFSESLVITGGQASTYSYVRSNKNDFTDDNGYIGDTVVKPEGTTEQAKQQHVQFYSQVTTDTNGNTKFVGNADANTSGESQAADYTYSSGFVTLADAAAGFKVTAVGHGGTGNSAMNTNTFQSSTIWYRYISGSGKHGKIEITSEGNPGGNLSEGTVLPGGDNPYAEDATTNDKPNTYVVAEGKTVTYTMTPEVGYKAKKITIKGPDGNLSEIKFNNKAVSRMKKGDSITVNTSDFNYWSNPDTRETSNPSKGQGVLTYEGDGIYTFRFNHAKEHEEIYVEWEPTTADILTYKIWADDDDKDGIRSAADTNGTLPKFKLQWSKNGRDWNDVTTQMDIGLKKSDGSTKYYELPTPVTEQTVPAGKVGSEYKDGTYVINNGTPATTTPVVRPAHPFTWEYLPVYTYDRTGRADRAIQYRIVEIDDPWHFEYEKAKYYEHQIFDLTSSEENSIEGWGLYEKGTNIYAKKGDAKFDNGLFYLVDADGKIASSPADPQPTDMPEQPNVSSSGYWTEDHAVPYHEIEAKNEHYTSDIYVDVVKYWNDSMMKEDPSDPAVTNEYARKDINIVLHGEIPGTTEGSTIPVDLNPSDTSTTDLVKTITLGETDVKENVTGYEEVDGYTKYVDQNNEEYVYIVNRENTQDGYYKIVNDAVDYTVGPYTFNKGAITPVKKNGDGTYKINDDRYGAMFEWLPTHFDGKHITYTVTETDTNGNPLDSWILTGGQLSEVKEGSNLLGYETIMTNTPDVDEVFTPVPLTIHKVDKNTGNPLQGAEFTVYYDAGIGESGKASQSEDLIVGKTIYTRSKNYIKQKDTSDNKDKYYEVNGETIASTPAKPQPEEGELTDTGEKINNKTVYNSTKDYIIQKDSNNKYKYFEVVNGTVASDPANPQPSVADLSENGKLDPEDGYTDGTNTYVKRGNEYYLVDAEGNVAIAPANPQPDPNITRRAKDLKSGQVEKNVVVTDVNGDATINFLIPNDDERQLYYYIKETKAPEGYSRDPDSPETYAIRIDADLKTITLENANHEHTTSWWKKLYDLIFGDTPETYTKWVPAPNKRGGTLTVENVPVVADILVRKYWNDSDNQDGKRPGDKENPSSRDDSRLENQFKLPTVTLQYTTGAHTAQGSNVYTDGAASNPKKYILKNDKYYLVTKEDVTGSYSGSAAATQPSNLTETSDTCKGLKVYKDDNDNEYVVIDQKYHEVTVVDVAGTVAADPANPQPDPNLLNLVMEGAWTTVRVMDGNDEVDAKAKVNYVGGPVLTHQNDAYTWTNLPAYRDGKLVTYRILEEDDLANPLLTNRVYDIESNHTSQTHEKTFHIANTSGSKPVGLNQTVDVTNRHDPQVINIDVYKKWDDDDPDDRKTAKLTLYKVVNNIATPVTKGEGTATEEDTGTVPTEIPTDDDDNPLPIKQWKDLPTYESGYPVTYRLVEESVEGYLTFYTSVYEKEDGTAGGKTTQENGEILAEDIKRTFYQQGDTLPEGKKVGDENTKARFDILNERSTNIKVEKTWINGANANVTYELWRTTVPEDEWDKSKFKTEAVDPDDPNRYYIRKLLVLTPAQWNAITDPDEKDKYTKKYQNNNDETDIISETEWQNLPNTAQEAYTKKYRNNTDPTDIISVEDWEALDPPKQQDDYTAVYQNNNDATDIISEQDWTDLDNPEQAKYTAKYVDDSRTIITKDTYEGLSDAEKAKYEIEQKRTWSPYPDGGKEGDKDNTVDGWKYVDSYTFDINDFVNRSETGETKSHPFNNLEIKDNKGNRYKYRILEKPELLRFRENQISDTEVINNNVNVKDGNVSLEVVKELDGRSWKNDDEFFFYVEPVEGRSKKVTDPENPVTVDDNKVPLPYRIDPSTQKTDYDYTADATKEDHQVGAIGRAATFKYIQYKENSTLYQSIGRGDTYEFYYKVYEVYDTKTETPLIGNKSTVTKDTELGEATGNTGYLDGITYDGEFVYDEVADGKYILATDDRYYPATATLPAGVSNKDTSKKYTPKFTEDEDGRYILGTDGIYYLAHQALPTGVENADKTKTYNPKGFDPRERIAKVIVSNNEGTITTEVLWEKNGEFVSGAVPVYTNKYSSEGYAKAWIEKKIANRGWVEYNNTNKTGDAFEYRVDAIAGANLNTEGSEGDSYTTMPLMSNSSHNPQSDIQQMSDTEYAFGIRGNRYDNTMLNANGKAYFIYELTENSTVNHTDDHFQITDYKVDGLDYDKNRIYARVLAEDQWDGTISFTIDYFTDASCKEDFRIKDKQAWISDDGTETEDGKKLLSMTDAAEKDAAIAQGTKTYKQLEEEGFRKINLAYFTNYDTIDIPVKKEWVDGPAIEDVNLHLERHLFPITGDEKIEESTITDSYVKSQENNWQDEENPFWQTAGYTHISKRGEYLKNNGEPNRDKADYSRQNGYVKGDQAITADTYNRLSKTEQAGYQAQNVYVKKSILGDEILTEAQFEALEEPESEDTSSKTYLNIDGFNNNLPKYEVINGVTYRIVYRLLEDDTSNSYTTAYKSVKDGVETEDDYIYTDGETLVVTNTVTAKNSANVAAVKQLLNRNWLDSDDFKFILTPVGKYDKDGNYVETTDIPMPMDAGDVINNDAHAKKDESTTVDPNGNLERLARFGEIKFVTDDLVYNSTDKHYHGDFFYTMKEEIPASVYAVDKQSLEKVDGVTFSETNRENYFWKDDSTGLIYDGNVHEIHISVKENRTEDLQVQVAYDEKTKGTISTGTQFTPVFTNRYDAVVEYAQVIDKYIMGRDWKEGDVFDFRMTAVAGAPFEDADSTEFHPQDKKHEDDTYTDAQRNEYLKTKAVHSARGAHVKRLEVTDASDDIQTLMMPKIEFRLSELDKTVEKWGDVKYSNGNHGIGTVNVPVGTAYGQFIYAFEETNDYLKITKDDVADLDIDPDTEYARVTVIDKGNGTLDYYTEIFEDRYCTIPRYIPGTIDPDTEIGTPAKNTTFANKLKRELSITKAWAASSTSDITLRLQWSTNGTNWYDVDDAQWMPSTIRTTQTIARGAFGEGLTKTWYNLPAYANIKDYYDQRGDDQDLNDVWIYYRIVEDNVPNVITKYSTTPYVPGESYTLEKYKDEKNAPHTGPEREAETTYTRVTPSDGDNPAEMGWYEFDGENYVKTTDTTVGDKTYYSGVNNYVTDRVKQLYVTNWPEDITGEANVGVVKQYIGKDWDNEVFNFIIEPIESMIGSEKTPVKEGVNRKTGNYVKKEGDVETVISKAEYDAISNPVEKAKYTEQEKKNSMPEYNKTNRNVATAKKEGEAVSVNEYPANFDPLTIKLSDLAVDYSGTPESNKNYGKAYGTFYYKITEIIPDTADKTGEKCGKDSEGNDLHYWVDTDENGNKIKYTTEEHIVKIFAIDDGSGNIDITTSFDTRNPGEYVPVYTNYAMKRTPIEGTKTWKGGLRKDHRNGDVELNDEATEIVSSNDELELKLQRKIDSDEGFTTITKDDARRDLVIVWVKYEEKKTEYTYTRSTDTEIDPDSDKKYYKKVGDNDYEEVLSPTDEAKPNEEEWYERSEDVTPAHFEKQEGEDSDAEGKGSSGPYTYTIMAKDGNDYVDPFLNVTDKEGKAYTYQIDETKAMEDYDESIDGLDITNTNNQTDDLKVSKTWDDAQNAEGARPTEVTVHLYKVVNEVNLTPREKARARESVDKSPYDDDEDGEVDPDKQADYEAAQDAAEAAALVEKQAKEGEVQVEVAKKTITKQGSETDSWATGIVWEDLPLYDENGDVIKYVVLEESVAGYTATYAVDSKEKDDYKEEGDESLRIELDGDTDANPQFVDIKNSLTPATNTVKVTKKWEDQNDIDGARPDDVTFQLYKYVWDPDANGGKGAYKTTEELVSGENGTGRPATQADVDADKAAKGDASTMKVGDIIKIEDLVLDGTAETDTDGSTPSTDDDVDTQANETTPTNTYTWNGEWINLPLTENGKTILYIIKEVIPEGADSAYGEPGTEGKYSNDPCIRGDQIKGYTATNTYTPEVTSFEGIKEWVDGDSSIKHNNSAELMDKLTLWRTTAAPDTWDDDTDWDNLGTLAAGMTAGDFHVDWSSSTLLGIFKPDDKFTITGLPKKSGKAETYYYKVTETTIDGYDQTYDNSDLEDANLKNRTDAIYSGGTVENAAKVGDVEITKKFVYENGKAVPKATLPSGFKIMVSYVWNNPETKKYEKKTEPLKITDDTPVTDGVYKWTLSNVVAGTKVTAEESGYDSPTGYSYVSSTATVNGDDEATHLEDNPTYVEFTMPIAAADKKPIFKAYHPGEGGDAPASVAFVNTYKRNTGTIEPVKIWDDNSNAAGKRPETVTFTITAKSTDLSKEYAIFDDGEDGKKSSMTFTFAGAGVGEGEADIWYMNEDFKDQIENLPTHTDNGDKIKYVVEEKDEDVPKGYQRLYPQANPIYIELSDGAVEKAEVTNAYRELVITKQWLDVDGKTTSPTTRRPSADQYKSMVKLYADGVVKTDIEPEVTDNRDGTYTIKWEGLPKNAGTSVVDTTITYTAKEDPDTINGYAKGTYSNVENPDTAAREANVKDKALNGGTITNNQLVKVDVVKEWKDNQNHDGQRPEQIKVTLYQNGVEYKPEGESSAEKELTEATATPGTSAEGNDTWTWTGVWTDLPYADANGSVYNYTATETGMGKSEGLWGVLTNESTIRQILLQTWNTPVKDTLTFNIANDDVEDKTGFTVDKIWKDGSDVDKLRPATINYRLYQSWAGHAEELVKELPEDAKVKTVTNGAEPEDADYAKGYVSVDAKKPDTSQGTLNRVIFSGLPEFAASGKKITYTIKEDGDVSNDTVTAETTNVTIDPIRGYNIGKTGQMPVIGGSQTVGYTVTNEHTPVSAEVTPKAVKKITGRTFKLGEDFTFKLAVDENSPKNTPTPTPDWVTIKADATDALGKTMDIPLGVFKFTGADMTDKTNLGDTKEFKYNLVEVKGGIENLAYDSSTKQLIITLTRESDGSISATYKWKDADSQDEAVAAAADTFTNEYGAKIKLNIRKRWIDKDADGTVLTARPTSVKVLVTATTTAKTDALEAQGVGFTKDSESDTKYTKEVTITGDATADYWDATALNNLPKYDAEGEEIKYEVSEKKLDNYDEPTITSDESKTNWTVTNSYVCTSIKGSKEWKDVDPTTKHDPSEEVKLMVYRKVDGGDAEPVIGAHVDWSGNNYEVIGLPKYNDAGKRYTYWVVEDPAPTGYTASYNNKSSIKLDEADDAIATSADQKDETAKAYNGGKIVNTFSTKKKLSGTKTWVGGADSKHVNADPTNTDDKLGIELKRDGVEVDTVKVDGVDKDLVVKWDEKTGDSTYRFGYINDEEEFVEYEFDIYNAAEDKAYVYTVEETDPPAGYTESVDGFAITNSYSTEPAKITPIINKKVVKMPEDVNDDVKTFTFILAAKDSTSDKDQQMPAPAVTSKTTVVLTADENEAQFDFGELTFVAAGTYTYDLYEQAEDGWTSNTPISTITIVVTDNDEGKLVAKVSGADQWTEIIPKDGENPKAKGWYVEDEETQGEYVKTSDTEVDDDTTYYAPQYSVVKDPIENTYDKDAKLSVPDIELTKKLTGDTRPLNKDEFAFTLEGQAASGSYKDAEGKTAAGTNSKDKNSDNKYETIEMSGVTFTKTDEFGDYLFILKETQGTLPGITYDSTWYRVVASLSDKDTDGDPEVSWKIIAKSTDEGENWTDVTGNDQAKAEFSNAYSKGELDVTPQVQKKLIVPEGSDRKLKANEFEFRLVGVDESGNDKSLNGKNVAGEAGEYKDVTWGGLLNTSSLKFTIDDLMNEDGSFDTERYFTFVVNEKPGTDKKIAYDGTVYTGKLRLYIDATTGQLKHAWTWANDDKGTAATEPLKFDNTYVPDSQSSSLTGTGANDGKKSVTKELVNPNGDDRELKANEFTFMLEGQAATTGTKDATHLKAYGLNAANGKVEFPAFPFAETGKYVFKLKEVNDGDPTVATWDRTEYEAVATVTEEKNGEETTGKLKIEWTLKKIEGGSATGDDLSEVKFVNKLKAETVDIPVRVSWNNDTDMDDTTGAAGAGGIHTATERPKSVTVTLQEQKTVYTYGDDEYASFDELMEAMPDGTSEDDVREAIENGTEIDGKTVTKVEKWVDVKKDNNGDDIEPITLTQSDNLDGDPYNWGDTDTWTDLPKYNAAGNPITYRVIQSGYELNNGTKEEPKKATEDTTVNGEIVEKGSTLPVTIPGYSTSSENLEVLGGIIPTFTNKYETTTIEGTKTWVDADPDAHKNASEVKLIVKRRASASDSWTTLSESAGDYHVDWDDNTFKIRGLTKYVDATTTEYQYQVTEEAISGYTTEYKVNNEIAETLDARGGEIINTAGKITVIAEKVWAGDSQDKSKRTNIDFQLYREIDGAKKKVGDATVATGTDHETNLTATWTDLAVKNGSKDVEYSVKEVTVPDGYKMTSKTEYGYDDDGAEKWAASKDAIPEGKTWNNKVKVTFTNTLDVNETKVVVQKKWNDDDDQDRKRPESVTVSIEANGWDGKDIDGKTVESMTLSDDNNWKSVFKKLPKTDKNGKVYDYIISEKAVEDYDTTIEYQSKADSSWSTTKPDDWNNMVRVTNSYTPGRITVEVEKLWLDPDDMTEEEIKDLHTDVIVHLYGFKNEEVVYYAGSKKIEMDEYGYPEGRARWTDVPKRYFNDSDLEWKVVEDPVFGYTSTVSEVVPMDEGNTHYEATVTNTYAPPVTEVKVIKDWRDYDNNDGVRPDTVYYQLWRKVGDEDPVAVGDPVEAVKELADPAEDDETGQLENWGYQWKKLPATAEVETEETTTKSRIEYQDVETGNYQNKSDASDVIDKETYEDLDEYGKSYYEYENEQYVNSETGDIKTPEEYEALSDKSQIDYVAVTNNVPKEVDKETVVKVTKVVPVYYIVKEVYTGTELETNKYEYPIVEATDFGEFNVINARKTDKKDIYVKKIWNDDNDSQGLRPDHVTFKLTGKATGTDYNKTYKRILTDDDKVDPEEGKDVWAHVFKDLPVKYKGEVIAYELTEIVPDRYEATDAVGDGTEEDPLTITNTYNPASVTLKATKIWTGDEADKSTRSDITFQLVKITYDENKTEIIDRKVVDGQDKVVATGTDHEEEMTAEWNNLAYMEKGKRVAYTVQEKDVPDGYNCIVGDVVDTGEKTDDGEQIFTVNVTNAYGVIPPKGDVIYVDPLNKAGASGNGQMILKSDRYDTVDAAREAAENKTDKPADPKHSGKTFLGWALNWDENDNFVLVATYSDIPVDPPKIVSYVDPQTGKIVTGEKGKVKKPANPKAKNMQFVKWVETTDAAGNTIFVAQYECDCSNGGGGKDVDKSGVNTGDDAMLTVWMLLFVMAVSFMILTMMIRSRNINAVRDNYRPKH